jgi:penicillin-binding protein 1A
VKAEMVSLYDGLKNSTNTVTARVLKRLGYKGPVAVKQLGVKMGLNEKKFINFPSICLGVMDLSVFEMVGAYATFVNKGIWTEPHFIKKIEDKNGNILEEFSPKRREAMREQTAYTMCKMLEKVTESGTGRRLHSKYDVPEEISIGGKTGTTQNNSDGWFMGITPDLVGGCWVGAEDRSVHFRNTLYGQGANMALPIYAYFINKVYKDKEIGFEPRPFKEPENALSFSLECVADSNQGKNNIDLRGLDF